MGIQLYDCSSVGEMCVTNNGNTDCGYGTCCGGRSSHLRDAPTAATAATWCSAATTASCSARTARASTPRATRRASSARTAAATVPACSKGPIGDTSLRCDGSVLVSCADGQEARQDCGSDNLGCFSGVGGNAFGCAAGSDCDAEQLQRQLRRHHADLLQQRHRADGRLRRRGIRQLQSQRRRLLRQLTAPRDRAPRDRAPRNRAPRSRAPRD